MAVLVGKPAPDFTATAVPGSNEFKEVTFSRLAKGKYAVVFFYPLDFTFVCPSELIAFDHRRGARRGLPGRLAQRPGRHARNPSRRRQLSGGTCQ